MNVVLVSCLAVGVGNFLCSGFLPVAPQLIPTHLVGVALSLQGLSACITLPFVGPVVDRVGSVLVLRRGLVLQGVCLAIVVASSSAVLQLLGRIVQGIAASVIFNSAISLVMDHFEEPTRAQHIGTVLGVSQMGAFVGTPLVSFVFSFTIGMPCHLALAFLPGILLLLIAYAAVLYLPQRDASHTEPLLKVQPLESSTLSRRVLGAYAAIGSQAALLGVMLLWCFCAGGALQCAGLLLMHTNGLSSAAIGMAFVPSLLVQALVNPLVGRLANTPRRRRSLLIASMCFTTVGLGTLAVLPFSSGVSFMIGTVVASTVVTSLATALCDAPSISLMTDLASACGVGNGEAVTASEMAVTLGIAIGPYTGQLALQWTSFQGLCLMLTLVASVVSVLSIAFLREGAHG